MQASVTARDIDSDGLVDLVMYNFGLGVSMGQPGGGFGPIVNSGGFSLSIGLGDLDQDGLLDVASIGGFGAVILGMGQGGGLFALETVPGFALGAAIADVTGDGLPDLITAGPTLDVLPGDGTGALGPAITTPESAGGRGLRVTDLDGDSIPDLAFAGGIHQPGTVTVFRGVGDGTFADRVDYPAPGGANTMDLAHMNADCALDIVVAGDQGVSILLGNGDGTFQPAQSFGASVDIYGLAIGDLDGNGIADVVASQPTLTDVKVFRGLPVCGIDG